MLSGERLYQFAVQLDYDVANLYAGSEGRGIFDETNHTDNAAFDFNTHANAAKLPSIFSIQLTEVVGGQVSRVWIKTSQHTIQGVFNEALVRHGVNVFVAYQLKDITEQPKK